MSSAGRVNLSDILDKTNRNRRSHRWAAALRPKILKGVFERKFTNKDDYDSKEILAYFPIALVTAIELFFRGSVSELINHGPPFYERASFFARNIKFDLELVRALRGKKLTVGDLIGYSLSFQNLSSICSVMNTLTDEDFLLELQEVRDRWEVEVIKSTADPIIADVTTITRELSRLFQVRHKIVHESPSESPVSVDDVRVFIDVCDRFLNASGWYVSNLIDPNAPLQQTPMTIAAGKRAAQADEELRTVLGRTRNLVADYRQSEFEEAQAAWERYRDATASYAYSEYKGGTLAPMVRNIEFERVTRERIEALAELNEDMETDPRYVRKE